MRSTENLNILGFEPLPKPGQIKSELPETESIADLVTQSREVVQRILTGEDSRCLVIMGPCSVHDPQAIMEYAARVRELQDRVEERVFLVMRAYFEKPRTTLGWKGMLYDPHLDDSCDIAEGLRLCRKLLLDICALGVPTATEFLEPIVPHYMADLVTWAAVGARTTESQIHRQMVSGLSMPVGFKNATNGDLDAAVAAIQASRGPHAFLGINDEGQVVVANTRGNPYGHLVLRGGATGPNYGAEYVAFSRVLLDKAGCANGIIVDCSHANSGKDYRRQPQVFMDVHEQMKQPDHRIAGLMLESHLVAGQQKLGAGDSLTYGQSVTDACIGWDETEKLILVLSQH
jgi:3-deoxy-7-phosphoheptulonate synthase